MSSQSTEQYGPSPAKTFAVWFVVGAACGAAAGLLLAPAPGDQTRAAMGERLNYAVDTSRIYLDNARGTAQVYADAARGQLNRLSTAVAAGVEEARRIKTEMVELQEQGP